MQDELQNQRVNVSLAPVVPTMHSTPASSPNRPTVLKTSRELFLYVHQTLNNRDDRNDGQEDECKGHDVCVEL